MNAVTIMEDVNSYASISQEDTTAPACKATPYRVMTHLVKVYIQLRIHINEQKDGDEDQNQRNGKGNPGAGGWRKVGMLNLFNGISCGFSYHSGVQGGIPIFLVRAALQESKRRKIKWNIEALCDKLCIAIK